MVLATTARMTEIDPATISRRFNGTPHPPSRKTRSPHREVGGSSPDHHRIRSGHRRRAVPGAPTGASHRGRLPRMQVNRELRSAAGAVGAADRTRSGAEQRARTTAIPPRCRAPNGTYACARVLQACSALGGLGHAANRWYGAPSTEVPCLTFAGPAADVLLQLRLRAVSSRYSQSMTVVSVP